MRMFSVIIVWSMPPVSIEGVTAPLSVSGVLPTPTYLSKPYATYLQMS